MDGPFSHMTNYHDINTLKKVIAKIKMADAYTLELLLHLLSKKQKHHVVKS